MSLSVNGLCIAGEKREINVYVCVCVYMEKYKKDFFFILKKNQISEDCYEGKIYHLRSIILVILNLLVRYSVIKSS